MMTQEEHMDVKAVASGGRSEHPIVGDPAVLARCSSTSA